MLRIIFPEIAKDHCTGIGPAIDLDQDLESPGSHWAKKEQEVLFEFQARFRSILRFEDLNPDIFFFDFNFTSN